MNIALYRVRDLRGFSFRDAKGSECSLQESSRLEPAIWLGVDRDFEGRECTRMELTHEQVAALLPLLETFVKSRRLPPR